MKTSILIFGIVLTTLGFSAVGYMNSQEEVATTKDTPSCNKPVASEMDFAKLINYPFEPEELFYNVASRFMTRITKENLHNAQSILEILPQEATETMESYETVEVCLLIGNEKICEYGNSTTLNTAQLQLLKSAGYSTDFYISSNCTRKGSIARELRKDNLIYYMTVIPENEAEYAQGLEALIDYLKTNTQEQAAMVEKEQLKPGKVNFVVTQHGTIEQVKLYTTSGYPTVDEDLVELIKNIPGSWKPATNASGERVDQEFVFFFGLEGC